MRNGVEHHADGLVAGLAEGVDDLEALEGADLLLALAVGDGVAQRLHLGGDVEVLETLLDRGGAHVDFANERQHFGETGMVFF